MARNIDPLTLAVVDGTLETTVRQMEATILRTARSPVLVVSHDFSSCLFDGNAQMIVQGEDQPVHLGALVVSAKAVAKYFEGEIYPGDLIYHNDPGTDGSHLPDMCMYKPIFYEDELLFWAVNKCHMADCGGPVGGGYNPMAEDIYAEGLRIPPIKIQERGKMRRDVFELILTNVRTRAAQRGDMGAQSSALGVAERNLLGLVKRYGKQQVKDCVQELIERGDKRMREEISKMPDGVYEGSSMMEDDLHGSGDLQIKCIATIKGSDLEIKLEAPPQIKSHRNSYRANSTSGVYLGVLTAVDPDMPHNEGTYRPVKIDLGPKGTVINAIEPAACGLCTNVPMDNITEAVREALSKAAPQRACGGGAHVFANVISGTDPRLDEPYVYLFHMSYMGGGGAVWGMDGWHCLGTVSMSGGAHTGDVELVEYRVPVHIHKHQLLTDTAGAGRWRGGMGAELEVEIVGHEPIVTNFGEGIKFPPPSLLGAKSKFHDKKVFNRFIVEDGEFKEMPQGTTMKLKDGDRIITVLPGGGGVGPAYERDPETVRQDVLNEMISIEGAREEYGVVIDRESLQIEDEATNKLRAQLKAETE